MIKGFATKEKTKEFATKHKTATDFYNLVEDLSISSLGVGNYVAEAYKEENYIFSFKNATKEAIKNGCNFIDTANNYRYQKSEREVGDAIGELINEGVITREELVISTKGGFIQLDYPFPKNPYEWIEENITSKKLAKKEDVIIDQHCMSPKYLEYSIETSLKNLNVETIDIYYLHNPEFELGHLSYEKVIKKITKAFELFEKMADKGKIKYYGIASWNAFTFEEGHLEYIKIKDLVEIAKSLRGDKHRFKFIQLPYNLAKPHAFNYTNQPYDDGLYYTPIQVAKKYGLNVVTSSALLQMNLFQKPFSKKIKEILGVPPIKLEENYYMPSDILYALQFARSAPEISVSLFSTKDVIHMKEDLTLSQVPKTAQNSYLKIFNL